MVLQAAALFVLAAILSVEFHWSNPETRCNFMANST